MNITSAFLEWKLNHTSTRLNYCHFYKDSSWKIHFPQKWSDFELLYFCHQEGAPIHPTKLQKRRIQWGEKSVHFVKHILNELKICWTTANQTSGTFTTYLKSANHFKWRRMENKLYEYSVQHFIEWQLFQAVENWCDSLHVSFSITCYNKLTAPIFSATFRPSHLVYAWSISLIM